MNFRDLLWLVLGGVAYIVWRRLKEPIETSVEKKIDLKRDNIYRRFRSDFVSGFRRVISSDGELFVFGKSINIHELATWREGCDPNDIHINKVEIQNEEVEKELAALNIREIFYTYIRDIKSDIKNSEANNTKMYDGQILGIKSFIIGGKEKNAIIIDAFFDFYSRRLAASRVFSILATDIKNKLIERAVVEPNIALSRTISLAVGVITQEGSFLMTERNKVATDSEQMQFGFGELIEPADFDKFGVIGVIGRCVQNGIYEEFGISLNDSQMKNILKVTSFIFNSRTYEYHLCAIVDGRRIHDLGWENIHTFFLDNTARDRHENKALQTIKPIENGRISNELIRFIQEKNIANYGLAAIFGGLRYLGLSNDEIEKQL